MGINNRLFDPTVLSKDYGEAQVDVVNQDPETLVMEFGPRSAK